MLRTDACPRLFSSFLTRVSIRVRLGSYPSGIRHILSHTAAILPVGLTFLALSVMLAIIAAIRQRHTYIDFSDQHRPPAVPGGPRIFGRPFVTAGQVVIAVTVVVAAVEIALLVLVLRMTDTVALKVSGLGHALLVQPS